MYRIDYKYNEHLNYHKIFAEKYMERIEFETNQNAILLKGTKDS